jgi:hypothetical protein
MKTNLKLIIKTRKLIIFEKKKTTFLEEKLNKK